jgi:hypothetical protein
MERFIHIIPLGWEADRAVLPVQKMKAHRAYILCNPSSHPRQRHFLSLVRDKLQEAGVEVVHIDVDADSDLKGIAAHVSGIIRRELGQGNRVYVNIAAAGKLAAIGAILAGMAHLRGQGVVYYVRPEEYIQSEEEQMRHGLTRGMVDDPTIVPLLEIQLPSHDGLVVLTSLAKAGGSMRYRELFQSLHKAGSNGFKDVQVKRKTSRKVKTRLTVRLSQTIIEPLLRANLVRVTREGRERVVHITTSGEYIAALAGEYGSEVRAYFS